MDLGLADKVAFVTGATRGIGRAIVLRLADEGCAVGLCARDAEEVQRSAGELRALGVGAHGVAADVTDEAARHWRTRPPPTGSRRWPSTWGIRRCSCAPPCRTCAPAAAERRCSSRRSPA
jgi:hypothetical protein